MPLEHAFRPLKVGKMEIRNRLAMSCMAGGASLDENAHPTDRMIAYYVERAKSRPGMMGIGAGAAVKPFGPPHIPKYKESSIRLYEAESVAPMKRFVEAVHAYDTKFGIQLWEGGVQAGGSVLLTPSGVGGSAKAVGDQSTQSALHILTLADIRSIIGQFGIAAERCAEAGFDFVEIHAGHGYLISSFLTPHFNHRDDDYGGSFENRTRFVREIMQEVKRRIGDAVTVGIKINGDDYLPRNGWELADACRLAPILEAEGADYLSVTAGVMGSPRLTVPPLYEPQACFLDLGEAIKKCVSIPVSIVGRIKNVEMAEQLLRDGKVDIVSMGRPMIADPELVEKARSDRIRDIRPCLADCRGCLEQQMRTIMRGEAPQTSCIVNPRVHREAELVDIPGDKAANPRTILVIGAGCSGMEAARRAAFSGHTVILCDRRGWLGGQVRLASRIPGRHEIGDIIPWYERQLEQLGVDVRLDTEVTEALIREIAPDVVVVATGSVPSVPQDMMTALYALENVRVLMADDLLEQGEDVGKSILVLGGEQIGLQIADHVSEQGAAVFVAEEGSHFASKLAANDRWYLTSRIIAKGVQRIKKLRNFEVLDEDAIWITTADGRQQLPGIDTIILANARQSDRAMAEVTEKLGIETHVIGDAADMTSEDSGTIFANIAQGYDLARHL